MYTLFCSLPDVSLSFCLSEFQRRQVSRPKVPMGLTEECPLHAWHTIINFQRGRFSEAMRQQNLHEGQKILITTFFFFFLSPSKETALKTPKWLSHDDQTHRQKRLVGMKSLVKITRTPVSSDLVASTTRDPIKTITCDLEWPCGTPFSNRAPVCSISLA